MIVGRIAEGTNCSSATATGDVLLPASTMVAGFHWHDPGCIGQGHDVIELPIYQN